MKRISLFWRLQIVGWLILIGATFPTKLLVCRNLYEAIGSFVLRDGVSFVITLAMRQVYRRIYRDHRDPLWIIGAIVTVSSIAALAQLPPYYILGNFFPFEEETIFGRDVALGILTFRGGIFVGWSILYFGIKIWLEKEDRNLKLERERMNRTEVELRMLRAQMNPHFLFNAFNAILAEIGSTNARLRSTVQALADFLRYSLQNRNRDRVELRQEVEAIRNYLTVEEARFPGELKIEWIIEEKTLDTLVPGILIQPLIENAIKYGRRTSEGFLTVNLTISGPSEAFIKIEVSNTGRWVSPEPNRAIGGVGLDNIRQRLALLYPAWDLLRTREENGWVIVEVQIPVLP